MSNLDTIAKQPLCDSYFSLLESMPVPCFLANTSAQMIFLNSSMKELLNREVKVGDFCFMDIVDPLQRGSLKEVCDSFIRGEIDRVSEEVWCVSAEHNHYCLKLEGVKSTFKDEDVLLFIAEDITARIRRNRELEQQKDNYRKLTEEYFNQNIQLQKRNEELIRSRRDVEASSELKSSILSNMSHEIRTPMNAILGFSSLLKDGIVSEEDQAFYLTSIDESGKALLRIIDNVIDLGKLDSGQLKLQPKPVCINSIFRQLENKFSCIHLQKIGLNLKIACPLNEPESIIYADSKRVQQVMENLILNALSNSEEGDIEIGYRLEGDAQVCFYVKDPGSGLKEELSNVIFKAFRRTPQNGDVNISGVGLGLTVCQKLVHLMGGDIGFTSKLGEGSTFYFSLNYETVFH